MRRARTHRSLRAEEVDKAARGRTPVYGGASGCFTSYGAQPGQSPRQLSRRITRAIVRSPRGRRTAAGVGEALLSALPPWRRGVWCGMTEPGVLASKLGIRSPRAASRSARPVSAFAPHTGRGFCAIFVSARRRYMNVGGVPPTLVFSRSMACAVCRGDG